LTRDSKSEQQALNTAVMVLLDNSGSMCDQVNAQYKRYQIANPAAFALHHALFGMAGVKVSTAMFCRSSSIKEPVNIVCGFGSKPDSRAFNLRPMGGTPTHKALWYARAALLQQPESWKIILILTDGYPSSRPQCEIATKRCIKDGIEIAALGIDTQAVEQFWANSKVIHNVSNLPKAMFEVMERLKLGVAA